MRRSKNDVIQLDRGPLFTREALSENIFTIQIVSQSILIQIVSQSILVGYT